MVERELKVEELPAQKREALEKPSDNRHVFAAGFEDGIEFGRPATTETRPGLRR